MKLHFMEVVVGVLIVCVMVLAMGMMGAKSVTEVHAYFKLMVWPLGIAGLISAAHITR